jgi:hypothetical protein
MFMHKKYMSLGSATLVQRAWRTKYVCSTAPSWSTIMMTTKNLKKLVQSLIYNTEKEILVKNVKMPKYPSQSIRKASQIVEILCGLTKLVLRNDLGLKPYKKPDLHEIETNDYPNTY